jgi:DNA polymerase I
MDASVVVARVRTPKGVEMRTIPGVSPYFYVSKSTESIVHNGQITGSSEMTFENGEFTKLTLRKPSDIRDLREMNENIELMESDIPYVRRTMIDKNIHLFIDEKGDAAEESDLTYKFLYFDIECDNSRGFPDPNTDCIFSMAGVGSDGNVFYFPNESSDSNGESEMIQAFFQMLNKEGYDVLVSWNGERFDFPYLETRLEKLNMTNCQRELWEYRRIDLLLAYKRVLFRAVPSRQSYSLDFIGQVDLGEGKTDIGSRFWKVFRDQPQLAKEYNIRDCDLMKRIDEKYNITGTMFELAKLSGLFIDEVLVYSRVVDTLILRKAHGHLCLPPKPKWEEEFDPSANKYEGALVFDPDPGYYENVVIMDFRALYPSLIRTFNISFETLDPNGTTRCPSIDRGDTCYKDVRGLIPRMLDDLAAQRVALKKEVAKHPIGSPLYVKFYAKQSCVKTISNTFYGYFGFRRSRVFKVENSLAITGAGRYCVSFAKAVAEEHGHRFIYGDTDSIMFAVKGDPVKVGTELEEEINTRLRAHLADRSPTNVVSIGFDNVADIAIFFGKKRYIHHYTHMDGKPVDELEITGIEYVRGDWPQLIKKTQGDLIQFLLKKDWGQIEKYVLDVKRELYAGNMDESIVRWKSLRSMGEYKVVPVHKRMADRLEKTGQFKFFPGEKVAYVVVGYLNKKLHAVHPDEFAKFTHSQKKSAYDYAYLVYLRSRIEPFVQLFGKTCNDIDPQPVIKSKKITFTGGDSLARFSQ